MKTVQPDDASQARPPVHPARHPARVRQRRLWTFGLYMAVGLFMIADGVRSPERQWLNRSAIVALHGYQAVGRPLMKKSHVTCRYTQSCSDYSMEQYHTSGFLPATWRTLKRLSRCRPGVPVGTEYEE